MRVEWEERLLTSQRSSHSMDKKAASTSVMQNRCVWHLFCMVDVAAFTMKTDVNINAFKPPLAVSNGFCYAVPAGLKVTQTSTDSQRRKTP